MRATRLLLPAAFFLALALPRVARAADVVLDRLAPSAIKLDGKIKEWPGTTAASETIKPGKATATFVAGYDDHGIWVGAEVVKDGSISRTASFGANEDCVSLILAFPKQGVSKGGVDAVYEIGVYAGVPGSTAGIVKLRAGSGAGKIVDGAKIVDAPRKGGGYSVEAFIPWSTFPEAKKTRAGLRGALRVYDGDGSSIRSIKASGPGSVDSPSSLGYLLIEPEQSLPAAFAARKQTWKDVTFDVAADLAGDGTNERALFAGRILYVLGPTYKEGKQWMVMDVGAEVANVEARDVTGDGHADLLVTTRIKTGSTTREALIVYALLGGSKGAETPKVVLAHETLVENGSSALRDTVTFAGGKKPTATIAYAAPKGWDAASYKEPVASDVDPILFPWGAVKERIFAFSGSAFVKEKEVAQKATAVAPPPTENKPEPAPAGDLVLAAFAQYKKDRSLPSSASPKLETPATIAPGKKGRAAVFGKDLVVATGGTEGYLVITMSRFASDKDILELTAKEMTGDGRDELIVRGIVRGKLSGPGGEKEVLREVVSIYAPKASGASLGIAAVFNAETARSIGSDRVESSLKLVTAKGSKAGTIEIGKGTAKGWTQSTYPFAAEPPNSALEPLVLPWGKESSVIYTWAGDRFTR